MTPATTATSGRACLAMTCSRASSSAGVFDRATGLEYREKILERGGSVDGDVLVRDFLGREPNSDAFLRELGLEVGG